MSVDVGQLLAPPILQVRPSMRECVPAGQAGGSACWAALLEQRLADSLLAGIRDYLLGLIAASEQRALGGQLRVLLDCSR